VELPVEGGRLYIATGHVRTAEGQGVDGQLLAQALRARLHQLAGVDHGAWGKISYVYGRHKTGRVESVVASAAVEVNYGRNDDGV